MKHITVNQVKEINSLHHLIKSTYQKKDKKLKIICDWDDTTQVFLPFVAWELKGKQVPFQDFYKTFWQEEFVSYSQFKNKYNLNKEGAEKRKYEELKRKPDFYKNSPFLSPAKELLTSLRENVIEELIFLTACDKFVFPNGDPRKSEVFKDKFGNFSQTQLKFLPYTSGTSTPKEKWIKENYPNFDIFIDDIPETISRTAETFDSDKIYVLPDYGYNKLTGKKIYCLATKLTSLTKENFKQLVEQQREEFTYHQELVNRKEEL